MRLVKTALSLVLPLLAFSSTASEAFKPSKVVYQKPADAIAMPKVRGDALILSAAPREQAAEAQEIFGPIAAYLGQVLGRKVVFEHAGSWGAYQGQMQKGNYDLVFDGAHFNGWRTAKLQHNVLVRVPGELSFVTAVRSDNQKITAKQQLAGRTVCAHAPPNLATLTFLKEFPNAARQPVIINTRGWDNIFRDMRDGKCVAAVLPMKFVKKNDPDGTISRVVFQAAILPDNALSAGPRVSREEQEKVVQALLTERGMQATQKLREAYAGGKEFVRASNADYVQLGELLRNEWGYY